MPGIALIILIFVFLVELSARAGRPGQAGRSGRPGQSRPVRRARDGDNWGIRVLEQLSQGQRAPWELPGGQQWRPLRPGQQVQQARQGQLTQSEHAAPADEVTVETGDYLGSMGYASAEGLTMHDTETVLGSLSLMLDDEAEAGGGPGDPATGPIATALAALRSTRDPSEGAGAAIVLAEILGPPRALRRTGPGGARSHRQ
ncbi:MAG: hypothetical protein Q8P31_10820 [Bacillota bacterium]|nr:hypothetical protein [Bacillota bacterium]